jgi:hypothetical protein
LRSNPSTFPRHAVALANQATLHLPDGHFDCAS